MVYSGLERPWKPVIAEWGWSVDAEVFTMMCAAAYGDADALDLCS